MAFSTPRFGSTFNNDTTYRTATRQFFPLAYATAVTFIPNNDQSQLNVGPLTGNMTFNIDTRTSYFGDEMTILFVSDLSSRTVTFGTNITGISPISTSTKFWLDLRFDGVNWSTSSNQGAAGSSGVSGSSGSSGNSGSAGSSGTSGT